jgi:hypothetical protein
LETSASRKIFGKAGAKAKTFIRAKNRNEGIQEFCRKQFGELASSFSLTEKLAKLYLERRREAHR